MVNKMSNGTDESNTPLRPGEELGKYTVQEQIGAGGMSVVFKGRDKLLGRDVAIKQVMPDATSPDAAEAFRRSFRKEARLHKQVAAKDARLVNVIEFIENTRGLFLVMELIDGTTLEAALAQHRDPMNPRKALGIIAACASALKVLHDNGVVHRDLKPSNILIDRSGELKLTDFGLAAVMADQDVLDTGSVRYMAPELFADEPVDGRADLYALGMVAYEMLAGRDAFEDAFKVVLRDQRNQGMRWMKWHTNPRATAPPLHEINPDVSRTLSDLVARLMSKDTQQRVASADELLEVIRTRFDATGHEVRSAEAANQPSEEQTLAMAAGDDASPTAELPRRKLSTAAIAGVVSGIVVFWVVVGVGYLGYEAYKQQQQVEAAHAAAMTEFREARELLTESEFLEASQRLRALHEDWPNDPKLGTHALALAHYAEAMQAFAEQDYESARRSFVKADDLGALQRDVIQDRIREVDRRSAVVREFDAVRGLINDGNLDAAERRLRTLRGRSAQMTATEREVLGGLKTMLSEQRSIARIQAALAAADRLVEQGDRQGAMQRLDETRQALPSRELDERYNQIDRDTRYEAALAAADEAERAGELDRAITQLATANNIREMPEVTQRLNRLRADVAYQRGRELLESNDVEAAEQAFTRALGYMPDHGPSQAAMSRMQTTQQRALFIRAGDTALAGGDYDAAIQQYRNAMKIEADAALRDKLESAQFDRAIARGREAIDKGQLNAAAQLLAQAKRIGRNSERVAEIEQEIQTLQTYREHLEAGDAARRAQDFAQAKGEYNRAKETLDTPEVNRRLESTEYESFIARARAEVDALNYEQARSYLQTALRVRNDPQAREMLKEVEDVLENRR